MKRFYKEEIFFIFSYKELQRAINAKDIAVINGFTEISSFYPSNQKQGNGYIQLIKDTRT